MEVSAHPIIAFFRQETRTPQGLSLADIQKLPTDISFFRNPGTLHYLFPVPEESFSAEDVPVITNDVIQAFEHDPQLRHALSINFDIAVEIYGFEISMATGHLQIVPARNFRFCSRMWLKHYDASQMDIMRILKSMSVLGLKTEALAFWSALEMAVENHSGVVNYMTRRLWERAVIGDANVDAFIPQRLEKMIDKINTGVETKDWCSRGDADVTGSFCRPQTMARVDEGRGNVTGVSHGAPLADRNPIYNIEEDACDEPVEAGLSDYELDTSHCEGSEKDAEYEIDEKTYA